MFTIVIQEESILISSTKVRYEKRFCTQGVTNDLKVRMRQHFENRENKKTFAGKYYCHKLIFYEHYFDINQAIAREKNIKDMSNNKKEELIASKNPYWNFLVI